MKESIKKRTTIPEKLNQRCKQEAKYFVDNKSTVRKVAEVFGVSKSTIHKDICQRLYEIDSNLYGKVRNQLDKNIAERCIRGGMATKQRYLGIKRRKQEIN